MTWAGVQLERQELMHAILAKHPTANREELLLIVTEHLSIGELRRIAEKKEYQEPAAYQAPEAEAPTLSMEEFFG